LLLPTQAAFQCVVSWLGSSWMEVLETKLHKLETGVVEGTGGSSSSWEESLWG
jgi:hypothetical protein